MKYTFFLSALILPLLLTSCGGGVDDVETTQTPDTARFVLEVTDAPVDNAAKVVIEYSGVEIKPANGESLQYDFDEPKSIDLIAVTREGVPAELLNETLPAGDYLWFRLKVKDSASYIELRDGRQFELEIPSGSESGLKVNEPFTLYSNSGYGFLIDFDLARSVVETGSGANIGYQLKPVLRAVSYTEANLLTVELSEKAVTDSCDLASINAGYYGALYLFDGLDAAPADIDDSASAPLLTVPVFFTSSLDQEPAYEAYFGRFWSLPDQDFTLAYSCDDSDDPSSDESALVFHPTTINLPKSLFADDLTVTVNFPTN